MTAPSKPTADASVSELVNQLTSQTARLVRDEMQLAQKEFQDSAKHAGLGAGLISVAGLLGACGFLTLIGAAVAALSLVLAVWLSAVIVAVVLFAAAGIAALVSRKELSQASPVPEATVSSVKEDIREVKEARHGNP
jgi:Flp pilus assembly protein TadB